MTSSEPKLQSAGRDKDQEILERTWRSPPGFFGWFQHVNQRMIGRRFVVTAFGFFIIAGIEALLMRLQLSRPGNDLINPDLYNQLFTMHGTTMMFLFAVPVMEGLGIYVVPLMLGTRDMAFPRLNAFGYYVYLIAGIVLHVAFLLNMAPDAGWFSYVPLAGEKYSPGLRIDIWATMITFIEVSALVAAVELIATIFKQRAPGMAIHRIPIFVWAILVMAFMILFAMPAVVAGSIMLACDRLIGTHFFNPGAGGDALLWQHLFWFFGHPEVYIIFIPGAGMVSSIVVAAAKRPMFGYTAVVLSLLATGFIGFGLWVHHMFTTGLPRLGTSFFTAASVMIAIPSGVQVFCWIATLWGSRPKVTTPLRFVLGFMFIFVLGGLTGVMVASVPFDTQVHDTYFVVAHLHYVLIGGAVFPLFGGMYHWFPKMTGRMLSESIGWWNFWLVFIGFNATFFPMHQLGLIGMPRRVYTYLEGLGWADLNLLATVGSWILAVGFALFFINVAVSLRFGLRAADSPWGADTLEWATSSPPPSYNFRWLPVVQGRWGLWDYSPGERPVVHGTQIDRRENLITKTLDAEPQSIAVLPGPTYVPLLLAVTVSVAFIGVLFSPWYVVLGFALSAAAVGLWNWPGKHERTPPWKEGSR